MPKKSKHPRYDDPSAFGQRWPRIVEVNDASMYSPVEMIDPDVKYFKMGKCKIILGEANENRGWFLSVRRNDRYPSWDEIVWIRYSLIPDSAVMSLVLPNLNHYINQEDTVFRNVFTLEQKGWALDPEPEHCNQVMVLDESTVTPASAVFRCRNCGVEMPVVFAEWNEQHSNGFHGAPDETT